MVDDTLQRDESAQSSDPGRASPMRARTWAVATRYCEPVDYGIPELPMWTVTRSTEGGLAFAGSDGEEPFIRAERPMRVRR